MEKLIKLMEKIFDVSLSGYDLENIVPGEVENWDSMGHLNLAMSVQDEFSVELTDEDIEDMLEGAGEIIKILKKHGVDL